MEGHSPHFISCTAVLCLEGQVNIQGQGSTLCARNRSRRATRGMLGIKDRSALKLLAHMAVGLELWGSKPLDDVLSLYESCTSSSPYKT